METQLIKVHNLKRYYKKVKAVDGLSYVFEPGQEYAIQGSSGSGKSTLLYMLGGLDRPTDGIIEVGGNDLGQYSDDQLAIFRNRYVGFVFQFHFLLPSMTCLENILLPSKIGGLKGNLIEKKVVDLSQKLGVEHCLKKHPYEVSGGEQQRINIIRALSLGPKLLLCDEPTGNLDSENSQIVTELIRSLAKEYNSTLVVVTHDDNVASQFTNRIRIRDGRLL